MATKKKEVPATVETAVQAPAAEATTEAAEKAAVAAVEAAEKVAEAEADKPAEAPAPAEVAKPAEAPAPAPAETAEKSAEAPAPAEVAKPAEAPAPEAPAVEAVDPLSVSIKNNGPRTYEVFTKTDLPAGETVVVKCSNPHQRKAVISKLKQLNALNKNNRYEIEV